MSEKLTQPVEGKNKVNWLPLILGSLAVLAVILFIAKGCNGSDTSSVTSTDTAIKDSMISQPVVPVRESMKVKLPDGTELNAFKGGIEDQLVIFLNNPVSIPGKDVWFDFDNLNFNTGSAQITESSMIQVQNIAAILKAYPKLKIKIGGYTDKTGDSLSNLKLSQSRASAVMASLLNSGSNKMQITGAEGYGSQYAKADPGASDEEKQRDRRISVSVRAK